MHAEAFLREFAPLASGPGGVQKLRELVLQLAVRGKLVPQNLRDEPAAHLLKQLNDKATMIAGKDIPKGWAKTRLSTFGTFVGGLTPSKARSEFWGEGMPWVSPKDMGNVFIEDTQDQVTAAALAETSLTMIPAGSLLLVARSGILKRKLPVAIAKVDCVTNQDMKSLVLKEKQFGKFLQLLLQGWQSKILTELIKTGTTVQSLRFDEFQKATWPIPPLAEQKRIVAKVDELMALCDALEARQAEETGLKRAAAASALHHLTEAKTPQETADRWSLLSPRFGELFDDLETIKALQEDLVAVCIQGGISPSSITWTTSTIGKLCTRMDSGWSPKCEDAPARDNAWGVLKTTSVQKLRFLPEENKALPTSLEARPDITVQENDILITRAGPTNRVGIACVVPVSAPKLMLSDKIIRFTVENDGLEAGFAALALSAGRAAVAIETAKSGMAASQVNISQSKLRSIEISYPPLAEQKRIVAKVDKLMALCDRLEEQVREGERLNAALMASLVHALTETDPDGGGAAEPAGFAEDAYAFAAPEAANSNADKASETKSALATVRALSESRAARHRAPGVDTKFQEAVLVAAIVRAFFDVGGEPIGNFRLQKAVYFARRHIGEHVGEMAYLKKAAGPYNPSMKFSGGIAIAKQKNWLREARGRFGFGHVPGPDAGDAAEWIDTYGYGGPARWVAEHFRFKKNEEWETLATVDYAMEHLRSLGIDPDAAQILQYIASDPEWRLKIEKLALTEMSVGTAMAEVQALFGGNS